MLVTEKIIVATGGFWCTKWHF